MIYKKENNNWKEKEIRENLDKRWELFNEFLIIKKEIYINFKYVLNNRLLFNPIDEIEKEELNYSEVRKHIDALEEYNERFANIVNRKEILKNILISSSKEGVDNI